MYYGITSGRVLDGELLYTKILEVLTSRIFVYFILYLFCQYFVAIFCSGLQTLDLGSFGAWFPGLYIKGTKGLP